MEQFFLEVLLESQSMKIELHQYLSKHTWKVPNGKRQILDCQKEGAQPVVSCPDLAKFYVITPPLHEQRAIAEALSDVDALLDGLDRLIAKKRDIKKAAMQELLTGKTRLPGFEGEWEVKRVVEFANCTAGGTPNTKIPGYWGGSIRWMSFWRAQLENSS